MTTSWTDFNDAESQNLIPKGTIGKVRLTIRPGGYSDEQRGWIGGYATHNPNSGAVYLNGEFTIIEGQYARRKVWSLIGLHSERGPDWANMGRGLIRGILNSANGISDRDNSPPAQARRRIRSFADLDGIEFLARIDVGTDTNGQDKNEIRVAVTPDHREYAAHMGAVTARPASVPASAAAPAVAPAPAPAPAQAPVPAQPPAADPGRGGPVVRPAWAQ